MKTAILGLCLVTSVAALAQSNAKIKAIRAANEAEEKAHAVASGIHKRDAGSGSGAPSDAAADSKIRPTPEAK